MQFTTTYDWILASASPRRQQLLSMLQIPFEVVTSDVEETSVQADTVQQYVEGVALLKARDVAAKCPGKMIIGADTIVVYKEALLHKPTSTAEAIQHLQKLSNNGHSVLTAVAIITPDGTEHTLVEETVVHFQDIPQNVIEAYVASGDPFDKAGGYGIQTDGALFVSRIEGDYNNVVGFPIAAVTAKLLALQFITI